MSLQWALAAILALLCCHVVQSGVVRSKEEVDKEELLRTLRRLDTLLKSVDTPEVPSARASVEESVGESDTPEQVEPEQPDTSEHAENWERYLRSFLPKETHGQEGSYEEGEFDKRFGDGPMPYKRMGDGPMPYKRMGDGPMPYKRMGDGPMPYKRMGDGPMPYKRMGDGPMPYKRMGDGPMPYKRANDISFRDVMNYLRDHDIPFPSKREC